VTIDELLAVCEQYAKCKPNGDDDEFDRICAACGEYVSVDFPNEWENETDVCNQCATCYFRHTNGHFPAALRCLAEVKRFAKLSADNLYPSAKIVDMIERFEAGEF